MGHQVLAKAVWSAIVMMLLTVVLVISCSEGRAEAEKEPIIFSDLNWTSAQFQNRVAQYIVEKGYGHPTDVVFGATLPLLQGLRRGDTQVTMEIWLPNQTELVSNVVEIASRQPSSLSGYCLLGAHR